MRNGTRFQMLCYYLGILRHSVSKNQANTSIKTRYRLIAAKCACLFSAGKSISERLRLKPFDFKLPVLVINSGKPFTRQSRKLLASVRETLSAKFGQHTTDGRPG